MTRLSLWSWTGLVEEGAEMWLMAAISVAAASGPI